MEADGTVKHSDRNEETVDLTGTNSLMRIAVVGPHSISPNGIGNYTSRLLEEFRWQVPCSITALTDLLPVNSDQKLSNWRGRELPPYWPYEFLEGIDAVHPQVVHIQHGKYLGYDGKLSRFLDGLNDRHIPCVITLHSVWSPTLLRRWPARFYRMLAANAVHVIVHHRVGTLTFLEEQGISPERITVIPHGTWSNKEIPTVKNLESLGIKGKRIVLFAGIILYRKGLHILLQAFPEVFRKIPEACLVVVGSKRIDNFLDQFYCFCLNGLIRKGLKEGWLIYRSEYVPDEELWTHISTAEVAAFPYIRRYGSSSGIFHRVLAAGRPAVCSNIPTFAEAIEAWGENLTELFPPPNNVKALSRTLIRILTDEHFRNQAKEASINLGHETSWPLVAREHLRLYTSLISPTPFQGAIN